MNEIETIFCKIFKCDRSGLYLNRRRSALSSKELNRLENILKKRTQGEPLQYLIGDADFMGINLKVSPGVLIPRPETEVLVEHVLDVLKRDKKPLRILDIGSGSGNIPIAIAKFSDRRDLKVYSVDISDVCLKTASLNAKRSGVENRIDFIKSDLFSGFKQSEVFDYIVSNPPYIEEKEYLSLSTECHFEPKSALVADEGGFYFYRKIEEGARKRLIPGGKLFLEIGDAQAEGIKKIFKDETVWIDVKFMKDLCGRDRVAIIKKALS
ncbi:MAG TPA: peptide chain release factor N(5)-glutamine methyltransferase [Candidatus Omnitrophota bacterium]|nr:peptide chain release factor N(5)-glutamine methyltransferase [Candidatus Omnitrophota bacterium]